MTQRNMGLADAVRGSYQALQAGDYVLARDLAAGWTEDPGAALLHALACVGAGDVDGGAAVLDGIARANPAAQHPALDMAELLRRHGRDPLPLLRTAVRLAPAHTLLLSAMATALVDAGTIAEAAEAFGRVTRLAPDNAGAWSNLGKVLAAQNRFAEAGRAFERAVGLPGATPQVRLNQAVATLKSGELALGWPQFHARHTLPGRPAPPEGPTLRSLAGVAGKAVLLLHNEGFGDTLQFIRYAPMLTAAGAHVSVLAPPQLRRLLRDSGIDAVDGAVSAHDAWCHIPDLPGVFGTTLETIPAPLPYLHADPARVGHWAARLSPIRPGVRRVGLVWAGEARLHDAGAVWTDRMRSIAPDRIGPLLETPGVDWVSLQFGQAPPPGMHDIMTHVTDFADTAAIVASLDEVVSVDTAVAHLAAAMGKPVVLLDRYDNCWRWLSGRTDSPWYPGVLRIVRQAEPGDWDGVLRQVGSMFGAR